MKNYNIFAYSLNREMLVPSLSLQIDFITKANYPLTDNALGPLKACFLSADQNFVSKPRQFERQFFLYMDFHQPGFDILLSESDAA